jgi:hypothetical protein
VANAVVMHEEIRAAPERNIADQLPKVETIVPLGQITEGLEGSSAPRNAGAIS